MTDDFRFCPRCGGALAPAPVRHEAGRVRPVCGGCGYVYYANPKVAAGAIFSWQGGVLLTRRAINPGRGLWVFPGGYVDRGESVDHAAVREVQEEVGLSVRLTDVLGVFSYTGNPVVVVVYAAEVLAGNLNLDFECSEARSFAPAEIPWSQLAFPSTSEALRRWLQRQ